MKFALLIFITLVLSLSCTKRELDTTPAEETAKMGGDVGTGTSGSLGSSNPGSETGAAESPSIGPAVPVEDPGRQ